MKTPPAPPSGEPPPETARIGNVHLALDPLARRIYEQYRVRFPDYETRYGDAAAAWCVHDTKYLLAWAQLAEHFGFVAAALTAAAPDHAAVWEGLARRGSDAVLAVAADAAAGH